MMKAFGLLLLAGYVLGDIVVEEISVGDDVDARLHHVPDVVFENNTELFDPDDLVPKMAHDRSTTDCGCGYSSVNQAAAGRIVNGQPVEEGSRPYQAYLQICFRKGCFLCGGTLINKRYVVTAMHCIVNRKGVLPKNTVVGLGMQNRYENGPNVQKLSVEEYITRDDYYGLNNDIAILKLSEDVQFNEHVQPACLPTDASLTYANQDAVVSGWGTTSFGGSTSQRLMEVTIKIVDQSDATCTAYGNLPMTQMCAYTASKDSCQGDSGGPLVLTEEGRNTLVGVVSYGRGCATPGYAGVYARVTTYLDWINANVADGWCGAATPAPTTTTKRRRPKKKWCKLKCVKELKGMTGTFTLNGILSVCRKSRCYAKDGSDLCEALGHPCAKQ